MKHVLISLKNGDLEKNHLSFSIFIFKMEKRSFTCNLRYTSIKCSLIHLSHSWPKSSRHLFCLIWWRHVSEKIHCFGCISIYSISAQASVIKLSWIWKFFALWSCQLAKLDPHPFFSSNLNTTVSLNQDRRDRWLSLSAYIHGSQHHILHLLCHLSSSYNSMHFNLDLLLTPRQP